jgi:soluble lytic murein transglycosylase-like protein
MLIAGAFVVPYGGKTPPKSRHSGHTLAGTSSGPPVHSPRGVVSVSAEFRLPADIAYEHIIQEAAARYRLDPGLIRAVIRTESAFDALAVSAAGAQGLMQIMPELAAELGVIDAFDPRDNIMGGVRYLRQLLEAHGGDLELALASYNAGPGNVARYHGIPPFPETQRYVKTITTLIGHDGADITLD